MRTTHLKDALSTRGGITSYTGDQVTGCQYLRSCWTSIFKDFVFQVFEPVNGEYLIGTGGENVNVPYLVILKGEGSSFFFPEIKYARKVYGRNHLVGQGWDISTF